MNRAMALFLGMLLIGPVLWGQGLDEINVVEMSWLVKCYRGIRPGTSLTPAVAASSYAEPAFFDDLGRDEDLAKERDLIKTTFNLADVRPVSLGELWLREKEPMGLITIDRENEKPLSIVLERLDTSWLHYRVTVYETNAESKAIMRSAFTIPSSMTLKDAVVFGFEDSSRSPVFLSLRITNLYADGEMPGRAGGGAPAKKQVPPAGAGATKDKPAEKPVITAPRLSHRVPPLYPEAAKKAGIEGTVVLSVTLDDKGAIIRARVIKSIPELDQAALDAVRQWKYEPMLVNGTPRPIVFTVSVEFKR
jgi:TonB family protein